MMLAAFSGSARTAGGYHLLNKIPAAGDGNWDYLFLDTQGRGLYVPHGTQVDATAFDPETKLIYNANQASVTIIHQDSADKYSEVQTLETLPRANTLALDPKTKKIYLSTAQYEEKPAATPEAKPRQVMTPGSFTVLVYGQ